MDSGTEFLLEGIVDVCFVVFAIIKAVIRVKYACYSKLVCILNKAHTNVTDAPSYHWG